jgi:multicomponent Na+:H+ antiporter subunit G
MSLAAWTDAGAALLLVTGAVFMLLAALGLLRLPDTYLRLSATSKGATLGATCLLLGSALHLAEAGLAARAVATVVFLFLTAPIGGHMIGRAAGRAGVPFFGPTRRDEWPPSDDAAHAGAPEAERT